MTEEQKATLWEAIELLHQVNKKLETIPGRAVKKANKEILAASADLTIEVVKR